MLALTAAGGFASVALASWGTQRAVWGALGAGALAALAGIERALREHFSRSRSRSGVLAGAVMVAVTFAAVRLHAPTGALMAVAGGAFALSFAALELAYRRQSRRVGRLRG